MQNETLNKRVHKLRNEADPLNRLKKERYTSPQLNGLRSHSQLKERGHTPMHRNMQMKAPWLLCEKSMIVGSSEHRDTQHIVTRRVSLIKHSEIL